MSIRIWHSHKNKDPRIPGGGMEIGNEIHTILVPRMQVEQNDVWLFHSCDRNSFVAVRRHADDPHSILTLYQHPQSRENHLLLTNQQDSNRFPPINAIGDFAHRIPLGCSESQSTAISEQ